MKKFVLNIPDNMYEKFRFEAIHQEKCVSQIIKERLFNKPFDPEVEQAYQEWMELQLLTIMKDE